jgi:SHS2 domain-containing protein
LENRDFKIVPHTADLKISVYGTTYEELFLHALVGMFQSTDPTIPGCQVHNSRIVCTHLPECRHIVVSAQGYEFLLIDFLSEALCLSDIYNEVYLSMTVTYLTPYEIDATLRGIKITGFSQVEIKAVTYHDLNIRHVNGHLEADIVFDI